MSFTVTQVKIVVDGEEWARMKEAEEQLRIYVWANKVMTAYFRLGIGTARRPRDRKAADEVCMMLEKAIFEYDNDKPTHSAMKVLLAAHHLSRFVIGAQ